MGLLIDNITPLERCSNNYYLTAITPIYKNVLVELMYKSYITIEAMLWCGISALA